MAASALAELLLLTCVLLLAVPGICTSATPPTSRKYLFLDRELFTNFSTSGLELVRHQPQPA
eukprot:SAG11_NODE_26893_length_339_cov_1.270833_1_plen_61_part_01